MLIREALQKLRELRAEVGPGESAYHQGYQDAVDMMIDIVYQIMWENSYDDEEEHEPAPLVQR